MGGTPGDHRESLTEITTKKNSDATKWFVRYTFYMKKIFQSTVKSLNSMFVLHRDLIPNDNSSLLQNIMKGRTFCNIADRVFMNRDRDFET
jgi:hypothetical protein